ncbi:MAG: sulfatase [Aggregatilineales bacterium]
MRTILLIILDTLRRDRLSIYGHARETSPAFDALAEAGTLFERAVAPAQWTIPAHASLFTGKYPSDHGVTQANSQLRDDQPVIAELLRTRGYHTVAFCNNPLVGVLNNGLQRGFDAFYNYASAIPYRPNDHKKTWLRREFTRRFRPYARRIGNQFAHSDALFRLSLNPLFVPLWTRYINFKGHTANAIGDLIDYLDAHRAGGNRQPLFVFVNLMGAHLPYQPPQDAIDRVAPRLRHDRQAYQFVRRFNADGAAWASPPEPPLEDWQQAALLDFYDAEIAAQDAQIGRLIDHLRQTGLLDEMTVILAADHGEGHGEHHLFGHGFNVHQELVHVPLAIYDRERFPRGARIDRNVSTRRLFHTLLDLAGIDAEGLREGRALSLAAVANGGADAEDDTAFSEAFPPLTFIHVLEHRNPSVIERMALREVRRAVYSGDHKLIARGDLAAAHIEGLYDLAADPAETWDLTSSLPEQAAALLARAAALKGAPAPEAARLEEDASMLEHLRALGYID